MNGQDAKGDDRPIKALWDQAISPVTFDFTVFLAFLDCYRQLTRPQAGIHLTIRAGAFRELTPRDHTMSRDEKRWRLKGILMDLCELLPTIRELKVTQDEDEGPFEFPPNGKSPYLAKVLVDWHKRGASPQVLKAPAYAAQQIPFKRPYVTLTLRMSNYFPDRNADLEAWYRFYQYLRAAGHDVIVVPDQGDVLGERHYNRFDWPIFEAACFDLRLRLALYEKAKMNVGSSNGPVAIMFYSSAPVLQFDHLRGGVYGPEFWSKSHGFPVGGQFPWSRPDQRMTWIDSTYENMVGEWTALKLP